MTPRSAYLHTPLGDPPPLRKFLVEERPHRRFSVTVPAHDADHARSLAREHGVTGPTFVTEVP